MVAIAITLLALALPVPAGFDGMTNGQLLHALGNDWDEYFPFLISFVVIANHWTVHRKIFRYVNRLDNQVIVANLVWLLMVIVIPFATRMLSGDGGFGVRFTLYALVQIIASACLLLMSMRSSAGTCSARTHPSRPGIRTTRPAWPSSSRSWSPFPSPSLRDGRLPCGGRSRCSSGCCGGSPALGGGPRTRLTAARPPGTAVRPPGPGVKSQPGRPGRRLGRVRGVAAAGLGSLLFPQITGIPS